MRDEPLRVMRWWPVATAVVFAVVTGGGLAMWLLDVWAPIPERVPNPDELRLDRIKAGLTVAAGLAAGATLLMTLRRQALSERAQRFAESDALEQRTTALYVAAAEQLGSDKAAVRLAGLYALERLGQDNPKLRQTVFDVWCAYLRMPYTPPVDVLRRNAKPSQTGPVADADLPDHGTEAERRQELQVRLTAQRLLGGHLSLGLADAGVSTYWLTGDGNRLFVDLVDAVLVDFNMSACALGPANFSGAQFHGSANFREAQFHAGVDLVNAQFHGNSRLDGAHFYGHADLIGAHFYGPADLGHAQLHGATLVGLQFHGPSDLIGAQFYGPADLDGAQFHGPADLIGAQFHGPADLVGAKFHGNANLGNAEFHRHANLSKAEFHGNANLSKVEFHSDVDLGAAQFHDYANLAAAQFHNHAKLTRALFRGYVDLAGAQFHGSADLTQAKFLGNTRLDGAQFHRGAELAMAEFHRPADLARALFAEAVVMTGVMAAPATSLPEGWCLRSVLKADSKLRPIVRNEDLSAESGAPDPGDKSTAGRHEQAANTAP